MSADRPTADSDVCLRPCELCGAETTNSPLTAAWICEDCVEGHDVDELLVATDALLVYSLDDELECPRCGVIELRDTFEAEEVRQPAGYRDNTIVDTHPDSLFLWCPDCTWPFRTLATPEVTDAVDDHENGCVLGRRSR